MYEIELVLCVTQASPRLHKCLSIDASYISTPVVTWMKPMRRELYRTRVGSQCESSARFLMASTEFFLHQVGPGAFQDLLLKAFYMLFTPTQLFVLGICGFRCVSTERMMVILPSPRICLGFVVFRPSLHTCTLTNQETHQNFLNKRFYQSS